MQTPGTNIREREGEIMLGIHTETFIQHLRQNTDDKGWSNFIVKKRIFPSKHGHTHCLITENKKKDAGTERK